MQIYSMEAIAASTTIKGKQPAYMPLVTMTQAGPSPISSYSSTTSSGSPSDNDEDAYFSDVSTSSVTSSTSSSSSLGDFVFDNDEEYADYFEIVKATIQAKAVERSSVSSSAASYSFSSAKSSSSSPSSKKSKSKSSYRKSTSSFFLSGASFPSALPRVPSSLAAQNPALNKAAQALSSKITKLNSYFPRERQVQEVETDEDNLAPACERCEDDNVDERFERALAFAQWSKRGRAGVWEAPEYASNSLKTLVASVQ